MAASATGTGGREVSAQRSNTQFGRSHPGVCGVGRLTSSQQLRNKYPFLERQEIAVVAPSAKSTCLGNKTSREISGVIWRYLAPGSICQAAHQSAFGCVTPRCTWIQAGTETPVHTPTAWLQPLP